MKKQKTDQKRNRLFRRILLGCLLGGLAFFLFGAVAVFGLNEWTPLDESKILQADQSLILYDKDGGEVVTLSGREDRIWLSLDKIPQHVRNAFIAAEDVRFYDHPGLDLIRIAGAAWQDIKAGAYVQGASTISQQLVKLSHLTNEKQMQRKLQEAVLALELEQRFEKDEILEMYLNYVYFGGGYYGVEAAARGYFGVHAWQLSVAQSAMLAGILKSPSGYAPHLNLDQSLQRRNLVLTLMRDNGLLSEQDCTAAQQEPAVIVHGQQEKHRGYYVDLALKQACSVLNVTMDELLTGGYRIYTAMDQPLQAYCEQIMANPETYPADAVQGAVAVVNAQNSTVAALVGGRDSTVAMAFNRAVDLRRQPGSIIKPVLVYAPALESFGYTAASMLLDEETNFSGYVPSNFGQSYSGWVTLREAVARSLNVPAVRVFSTIGVQSGKLFASRLGVSFDEKDDGLALALGGFTYGVSPLQIAGAYACFAAEGKYSDPAVLLSVTDAKGNILYERQQTPTQVMSRQNAYILTSMLQSAITGGTGRRLGELEMDLAGKTGTVGNQDGNRDAWMVAYNPEYSIAVWMGCDTAEDGTLPAAATGGTYPALLLKQIYAQIYQDRQAPKFVIPEGVKQYRLDRFVLEQEHEAVLATALTPADSVLTEVFVEGTQPSQKSDYWSVPLPPADLYLIADQDGKPCVTFTPLSEYIIYTVYREDSQGETQKIGEFSGSLAPVTLRDGGADFDETYQYYVVPRHPSLTLGGRQVVGASTPKYSFTPRQLLLMATPER